MKFERAQGTDALSGWTIDPEYLDRVAQFAANMEPDISYEVVEAVLLALEDIGQEQ